MRALWFSAVLAEMPKVEATSLADFPSGKQLQYLALSGRECFVFFEFAKLILGIA
jgi:hypothetical protein